MENPLPEVTTLLNLLIVRRGIAFASLDRNGCIQMASPNLGDFVEEGRRPAPGTPLTDLFIEFWGMDTFLQALLRGEEKEFRLAPVMRETADGHRYLSFEIFHIQDEGSPALLVVEDITRLGEQEQRTIQERNEVRLLSAELQRANAELRRLSDFKSTILFMAAHDLRTPITALSVRLDLLLEDLQTGQETISHLETLRWMRHSVGRMNYLLSGLLDREQAERGVLRLSLAPCDLVKVLQRVVSMAPPDATGRVELKTPGKLEIVADDRRLQQVFFNLMENALKYTPADQKVTIALHRRGAEAVVEVTDRGKGMTPEEVARLFQMFYRTEEARTSTIPGTGLGLFIVKTLVEAHQGRVEVDSRPGQGTTFRVYLPLRPGRK